MRADRLVAIVLLLQTRAQMTARDLAERLEAFERTIRRDLDALSFAGVPIYAQRGRNGGWRLLGGHRIDLSGLTFGEPCTLLPATDAGTAALGAAAAQHGRGRRVGRARRRHALGGGERPPAPTQSAGRCGTSRCCAPRRAPGARSWSTASRPVGRLRPHGLVCKRGVVSRGDRTRGAAHRPPLTGARGADRRRRGAQARRLRPRAGLGGDRASPRVPRRRSARGRRGGGRPGPRAAAGGRRRVVAPRGGRARAERAGAGGDALPERCGGRPRARRFRRGTAREGTGGSARRARCARGGARRALGDAIRGQSSSPASARTRMPLGASSAASVRRAASATWMRGGAGRRSVPG